MANYLITGGAGFIGSHLAESLVGQGHFVRVLDNLDTGSRENIVNSKIEFIVGSVEDAEAVRRSVQKIDFVLHQAARGSVPRSITDPLGTHTANSTGTLQVLIAARDAGVKKVICASSSSVYGDTPTLPKIETMHPEPKSPYALSKLTLEHYCRIFSETYDLPTAALRYFNIYGPRQNPKLQYAAVIPIFITRMLRDEPCIVYGDGEQTRDFTYVEDCAAANFLACEAEGIDGQAFNIGCRNPVSVNQLFRMIAVMLNYKKEPVYEAARAGDVKHSFAGIEKAQQAFNFQPKVRLEDGLERTIAWYKKRITS